MDKKIELSTNNVYVAKIILGSIIDQLAGVKDYIYKIDEYASSQVLKSNTKSNTFSDLANLLEFADDLAAEIVRVEMWEG